MNEDEMPIGGKVEDPAHIKAIYATKNPEIKYKKLVYHRSDNGKQTMVFIDKDGDIDWEWEPKEGDGLSKDVMLIESQVVAMESDIHGWPDELKLRCKLRIAPALACAILGDAAGATAILKRATTFVRSTADQLGRKVTVFTTVCCGALCVVLGVFELAVRALVTSYLGKPFFLLSMCFWSGCFGAMLFILLGAGTAVANPSKIISRKELFQFEAFSRVIAGGAGGVLVGLLVKLGIVLPVFLQNGQQALSMCGAAMLAGVSERLLKGVITNLSAKDGNGNQSEGTEE